MPSQEEREESRYVPYRGPISEHVSVEPVDDADLGMLMRLMGDALLPRADSDEDSATYETSLSEFEAWVRKMDEQNAGDDPPPSAPNSALPWWLREDDDEDDDQDAEKIAA